MKKRRGRGEGSIYQRADGLWCANASAGFYENGKRRRKTVYGKTKKEVQDKLRVLDPGTIKALGGKLTVKQWLETWLELRKGVIAESTRWRDEKTTKLKVVPIIGHLPLSQVDAITIERFYQRLVDQGASIDCVRRCGVPWTPTSRLQTTSNGPQQIAWMRYSASKNGECKLARFERRVHLARLPNDDRRSISYRR
jgi:hypothetical protein